MRSNFKFAAAVCGFVSLPSFGRAVNIPGHESSSCRVLPGDDNWPSLEQWSQLNNTVDGRLIATVPLGSPCHDPTYNEIECAYLTDNWSLPKLYFNSSAQIMLPYFQNHTCDPFTPETSPCTIGNLVEYSIEVTSAEDVAAGLNFAQDNNVRLVIKNTGHDFLGKSTGKGALGLWTHHLKDIEFLDYSSAHYSGPAIKMGAGVQAWEAYETASANGLRVVGGSSPTVGLAGGYSQGGGHSSLSSIYGLGADQTLEWEVVTADGQHLIATPTQNADLYWALSGGGPGTYAVVLSLTSKAHADGPVGGASIYFTSDGISEDTYWEAIGNWQPLITELGPSGASSIIAVTSDYFSLAPYTIVNTTVNEVKAQLAPFTTALDNFNISYAYNVTNSPGFLEYFSTYLGPLPYGQYGIAETVGSRLIPRTVVENNNTAITAVLRDWVDKGFIISGIAQYVPHSVANNTASSNAVLPAWRDSAIHMIALALWNWTAPWSSNVTNADTITNDLIPQLEALTPGSGTYLNEADFQLATWKEDFFGSNYDRLRAVKKKYDANNLFYALKSVGSDAWTVASDGRLCRA